MVSFHRIARHSFFQFSVALIAAGSWLSGCGDDEEGDGDGNGTGGSGVTGGSAGSTNGGSGGSTTGGSGGSTTGGSTTGGSAGGPTGGSAGGPTGGSGGSAGTGMGGEGMGGEGMGGEGMGGEAGTSGMGGMGMGGEGGSTDAMCATNDLNFSELNSMQAHDHLPINGMARMTLLNMINTGMPLVYTMPEEGSNPHQHTLTFTAQQLTTLRNGGTIAMITSSTNGPTGNMHTHTYSIECAP